MNTKSSSWPLVPVRRKTIRPRKYDDCKTTTKAQLRAHTKEELIVEIHRLQTLMHEVAVELGIERRAKSSELTIDPQFVGNIMALIKAGRSFNL